MGRSRYHQELWWWSWWSCSHLHRRIQLPLLPGGSGCEVPVYGIMGMRKAVDKFGCMKLWVGWTGVLISEMS